MRAVSRAVCESQTGWGDGSWRELSLALSSTELTVRGNSVPCREVNQPSEYTSAICSGASSRGQMSEGETHSPAPVGRRNMQGAALSAEGRPCRTLSKRQGRGSNQERLLEHCQTSIRSIS